MNGPPPLWRRFRGRLRAAAWRFRTLSLAQELFGDVTAPCILERRLFGRTFAVDVSRSDTQRLLWLEGERFLGERRLLRRLLRPGQSVVDVGANIGYYVLLFAEAVGSGGTILCLEPEPDNLVELRRNVERNALPNVEIFPVAAGSAEGTVSLSTGINGSVLEDGSGQVLVPLRTLDELLAGRPVDFIKIDVEGYEGHVLDGAARLLRERRPALFVEIHPWLLGSAHSVDGLLRGLGALYPRIELWEIAPQGSLAGKIRARYLGAGVRPVPDREALLAACRAGGRQQPFWAVCPADRGGG